MILLRKNNCYDEYEQDSKSDVREKIRDSFEMDEVKSFCSSRGLDFNDYRRICLATADDNKESFGLYRFTLDDVDAIITGVVLPCPDDDAYDRIIEEYEDCSMLEVSLKRKRVYVMLI